MSPDRIALDTNILVYAFDHDAGARHHASARILDHAISVADSIFPLQVLSEFSTVALRKLRWPASQVHRLLLDWNKLRPVIAPTFDDVEFAVEQQRREPLDHWDAVLMATCIRARVRWLVTEDDHEHWRAFGTLYCNPFESRDAWKMKEIGLS
jgi:predicted nucleic acid-binding protein